METPSPAVCAFINAYIESIDLLRVLLVLARHPDRDWVVEGIASETALSKEVVLTQLQRLATVGLANLSASDTAGKPAPSTAASYQYSPRAVEFDEMVQELIQLDNQKPVTLIRLVYSRKSTSAQAFADAFRLRRD